MYHQRVVYAEKRRKPCAAYSKSRGCLPTSDPDGAGNTGGNVTRRIKRKTNQREYDFALIIGGVDSLNSEIEDALFKAGCDDATLSIQYGRLYVEFSRTAPSLKVAVLNAIRDVRNAGIGAEVLRVDDCNLVTPSEIARRIKRSRQLVFQYINGQRGPGGFPPPECHLSEGSPIWNWCAVSRWLAQNNILRSEDGLNAEILAAINNSLETIRQRQRNPELIDEIAHDLT